MPDHKGLRTTSSAFIAAVIFSFVIFIPDLHNGFLYTWDDGVYIAYNEHIRTLSGELFRWAFLDFYATYWAPLTWISFALDYSVWGLNPVGYHLTNNVIHSINAGMFFLLSLELIKIQLNSCHHDSEKAIVLNHTSAIYCSLLAAFFFALHPLRVESVAWATARKDVLSLFFGLPAILFYLKHTQCRMASPNLRIHTLSFFSSRNYWISITFFSLSLLSKSMLVTLPLVLLVMDWFPLRRLNRSTLIPICYEKVPFLLLSGIASVLTIYSQSSALLPYQESNLSSRFLIAGKSIVSYLWMTFWPAHLSPFYLHPGNVSISNFEYQFPLYVSLIITVCCIFLLNRWPALMATWLIYLITLLPILGITYGGNTAMADRFTYVPGLSVSLLSALGVVILFLKYSRTRPIAICISATTLLTLLASCYLTVKQISHWKDDVALWSRAIDVKPHFSGRVYYQRGRSYAARGEYQKALTDINEALSIATRKKHREMGPIFIERARILQQLGDINGAITDYSNAIASSSSSNLSMYYLERGKLYEETGRTDLANEDFKRANGLK